MNRPRATALTLAHEDGHDHVSWADAAVVLAAAAAFLAWLGLRRVFG